MRPEARLAARATDRLQALLIEGALENDGGRDDRYGRSFRTVTRDGESLGAMLLQED